MSDSDIPRRLVELVGHFTLHRESYLRPAYNEAQVRAEFIDPFFEALGWDVNNASGVSPVYRDVIHEDAIKVGGFTKAPDYCFRVGGARRFFVEAKKPAINIKTDPSPAFQLRRYAWSAKMPVSILTNFEEFAVYDCRIRPHQSDSASTARIMDIRSSEYAEKWSQIAAHFGRDEVVHDSIERYAGTLRTKRGTAEVDDAFLSEIEEWRDSRRATSPVAIPA